MKSERRAPACVSFVSVASACDDTLIEDKLEFFAAVAKLPEAPITPFLALSLKDLLLAIIGRFLKKKF